MNSELRKCIKTSIQGICVVLALNIIANIFGIITCNNILEYIEHYGVTYLYMTGLITGLVLYNKGKAGLGAETVQWVGLGTMIVSFANAIMVYAISGTLGYKVWFVLIYIIVSSILVFEALSVIRNEAGYKSSKPLVIASLSLIMFMLIMGLVSARNLKIKIEIENHNKNQQLHNEMLNGSNKEEEKEEKLDPTKTYENIEWGKTSVKNSDSVSYEIQEGKIEVTVKKNSEDIAIVGEPIKFTICEDIVYVLTKDNQVYYLNDKNSIFKFADVTKYNVVDIATVENHTNESIYFLTKDGKLIDKNGVSYNKYNFVGDQNIELSNLDLDISFDKDGYVYYYNGSLNEYENIVDKAKNENITAKEIYTFASEVLIITNNNTLYSFDGKSNKAIFVKEKVSYVAKKDGKTTDVVVAFEDKTIEIYSKLVKAYKVKDNSEISVDGIADYDAYEHHKDQIWSGVKTDNANIKNNKLYIAGNEIITGITGELKSVEEIDSQNSTILYVLTDAGKAWAISLDKVQGYKIYKQTQILSGYKLLDMTIKTEQDNIKKIYYLTEQGKLLDAQGNQYVAK